MGYELGSGLLNVAGFAILGWAGCSLLAGVALGGGGGVRRRKTVPSRQPIELQSVLQSLPEAVFLFDCKSRIVDVNQPAEQLVQVKRTTLLGKAIGEFGGRIEATAESRPETLVARALRGETVHQRQAFRIGEAGESRELLVSARPVYNLAGSIVGGLLVAQDVSELSALQRRVANSERHLDVGQMTAGLAHDFNNVLSSISEAVYVLETEPDRSAQDRNMLRVIDGAVRRGAEIVSNIREYLRGGRDARIRIDLPRLLDDVLQMTMALLETRTAVTAIRVVRHFDEVPPVLANPAELRRVFTNLVRNGVEAMPQGGTLTVRCYEAKGRVVASVADSGAGIPLDQQSKIFSPYYTTKPTGTGLGLSGARRAIQAHGGEIGFESTPGVGSAFYVVLPAANGGVESLCHPSRAA